MIVHIEKKENKKILKISIASGPEKPYFFKKTGMTSKGCFIRIGSASEPMPQKMIEELFSKRTRNSIGRIKSIRQDLTFEQLKIYFNEIGLTLTDKFASNLELYTEEGAYNYAAYLLADNNGNSIQVAKYSGNDRVDLIESHDYGNCSLIKTCKQILDRLDVENRTMTKITSKERISQNLWDPVALREAVINAIIHNDYANEAVPKIEIFNDRLEITSAGTISPGFEQNEFFQGYSIPRNKILMRVFKDMKMVEYLGSGIPRILKAYPKESYIFTSNFIRIVLPIQSELIKKIENSSKFLKNELVEGLAEKLVEGLVENQIKMLTIIKEKPYISKKALSNKLNISTTAIDKNISQLKKKKLLKRVGPDKGGYWKVIEGK